MTTGRTTKLARQLAAVDSVDGDHWVMSSRMVVLGPGTRERMWPRRLIKPGESVAEYLFRFNRLGFGNANLQTSTLCFPTDLGRSMRWGGSSDEPHDEPSWLIGVQRTIPDLRVIQLPEMLSIYNVHGASVSRDPSDRTETYIEWGLQYLGSESPRVLGDYLCTSPVSAAVSARSLGGVRRAVWSAVRHGRPGPFALAMRLSMRPGSYAYGEVVHPPMTMDQDRLTTEERRALLYGPVYRIIGTPIVAFLGLANTAIIVRETGEAVFGLVSLVATITLLFPFADLGIGATVLSASAQLNGPSRDPDAPNIVRRAYHVLFAVAGALVVVALCVMALDGWGALIGFSSGADDRWAITVAACVFALTIPAGLGGRILVGIDRNPLATLALMSCPAFASRIDAGAVYGRRQRNLVCGLGIGRPAHRSDRRHGASAAPVGTGLVGVCPRVPGSGPGTDCSQAVCGCSSWGSGCRWAHRPGGFCSRICRVRGAVPYALMAQIYAVCWSVLSTAALAYWPVFVKRRAATEETVRMWWQLTATFAAMAAIAMLASSARPTGGNGVVRRANRRIAGAGVGIRCVTGGSGRSPADLGAADQTQRSALASTVGAGDGRDQHRSRMHGGSTVRRSGRRLCVCTGDPCRAGPSRSGLGA